MGVSDAVLKGKISKSSNTQYWAKDRKDIFNSSELRLFHSGDSNWQNTDCMILKGVVG